MFFLHKLQDVHLFLDLFSKNYEYSESKQNYRQSLTTNGKVIGNQFGLRTGNAIKVRKQNGVIVVFEPSPVVNAIAEECRTVELGVER